MLSKKIIDHLRQKVGAGNVYQEKEDLLAYGYDATPEIQGLPDVAVFSETMGRVAGRPFSMPRRRAYGHPSRGGDRPFRRQHTHSWAGWFWVSPG